MLLPLVVYGAMRLPPLLRPEWAWTDPHLLHPHNHFYIVTVTALVALVISVVVAVVGLRQRNLQVLYVALAFISLAGFFSVHGLATPGFLLGGNAVVGVAAQLAALTTSFWLLVSALPVTHPLSAWLGRRPQALLVGYTLLLATFGVLGLRSPELAAWVPVNSAPLKYVAGLATVIMAGQAGYRYWESYRYTRFPFQLAIAYTGGWVAGAQLIITTSQTFYSSWWIYHFLLLFAVISVVAGLFVQYRRHDSFVRSVVGLFSEDPHERLPPASPPAYAS
ncbi:MAG: hypothetical protein KIS85_07950 [Anaerolineales bacterium]|nr:hypothetical protein [Anaerolineales bacterium]